MSRPLTCAERHNLCQTPPGTMYGNAASLGHSRPSQGSRGEGPGHGDAASLGHSRPSQTSLQGVLRLAEKGSMQNVVIESLFMRPGGKNGHCIVAHAARRHETQNVWGHSSRTHARATTRKHFPSSRLPPPPPFAYLSPTIVLWAERCILITPFFRP